MIKSYSVVSERAVSITATAQTLVDMGFTSDEVNDADIALITCEAAARYKLLSTTAPTASEGHYIGVQVQEEIHGKIILSTAKFIRVGGANVVGWITLARL